MRKLLALFVLLAWQLPVSAESPAGGASPGAAGSAAAAASAAASLPTLRIERVLVRDRPWFARLTSATDPPDVQKKKEAACRDNADYTSCNPILVGTGELELVVPREDYDRMAAAEKKAGGLVLYVNGVPLPADAKRVGIEHREDGTHLRFRIEQGVDTQTLWSSLYRYKGLLGDDSLRVALGWSGQGPGTTFPPVLTPEDTKASGARIAVTSSGYVIAAAVVVSALIVGLVLLGRMTDALRGAPVPPWWREARRLRARLDAPGADEAQVLGAFEPSYDPAKRQESIDLAEAAVNGRPASTEHPNLIPIGLALGGAALVEPRHGAYSLARTQMAMWFAFAIAAGLFLWIIYGELRRIDGSLLALLLISVGTTGISIGVDNANAVRRLYTPSRGFFLDLVTDPEDTQQVHRYQAVVVNLLLLFVGVVHVVQQLTYPIFEPTWLAFLGVSGATLGLGKQVLENRTEAPAGKPGPAPAASPGRAAAAAPAAADGAVG